METLAVAENYKDLHKMIFELQQKWKKMIKDEQITATIDKEDLNEGVPVSTFAEFHFDIPLYIQWIEELTVELSKTNNNVSGKLARLKSIINEEIAECWLKEALAFNHLYFADFAEKQQLDEWIPHFVAESAARPYLHLLAEKVQDQIEYAVPGAGCPVCGEPARLAMLEGDGQKVLHCPRCLAHWRVKRLECPHCGNTDHEKTRFLTIEGDPASQIQVCDECGGYIKIIDTRQYLDQPAASLLDLTTIHLDFIAQENGYQAPGKRKQTN